MIKYGAYRLAISEDQLLVHVVSEMDVLRYVYENRKSFVGDSLDLRALQLPSLGSSSIELLREDQTFEEACLFIVARDIQGVPIVDKSSKMIGYVSPATLLSLVTLEDKTTSSRLAVKEMRLGDLIRDEPVRIEHVWVTIEETFGDILQRMTEERLKRVFVVGDNDNPLKVITVSDVIRFVLQNWSAAIKLTSQKRR